MRIPCCCTWVLPLIVVLAPARVSSYAVEDCYLRSVRGTLLVGNAAVEMEIDSTNGYIRGLRNKASNVQFRVPGEAVWPFGLSTGTPAEPRHRCAEIRDGSRQQMTYRSLHDTASGALTLEMRYGGLKDNVTGATLGVQLTASATIRPGRDYFSVTGMIENRGDEAVTEFYAWRGAGLTPGDGSSGTVIIPHGVNRPDPPRLRSGLSFASPGIFLSMGWADLSGSRGGVGVGYLNRRDVQAAVRVQWAQHGSEFSWTFFNLEEIAANFGLRRNPAIYPLAPGECFQSDEWILVPHRGDWHDTACAYRQRYEEIFANDYRSWDQLSAAAKNIDIWAGMKTMNWWTFTPASMPKGFRFDASMVPLMKDLCERFGALPGNVGVSCMQTGLGTENPLPDLHKCAGSLGGCSSFSKMAGDLRERGFAAVLSYVFFWDQKPVAATFMPAAAPSIPAQNRVLPGNICLDNSAAYDAWNGTIIPGMAKLGANAVYFDLGSVFWRLCEDPDHIHGDHSLGILTAGTRGIRRMLEAYRRAFGDDCILETEAKDDVRGRYYDIWHGPTTEMLRYTHPARLIALDAQFLGDSPDVQMTYRRGTFEKIASAGRLATYALLTGCQLVTTPLSLQEENLKETRQFVRLRRELRQRGAPGYPHGYRDTDGLTVSHPDLEARAFTDRKAITVVYCNWGSEPRTGTVAVDGARLGMAKMGRRTNPVNLQPGQAGYFVLR